ncbi:hypothetical protein [Sphingomonas rubra]|uniref:hypothetical protein n=1 Tax=Sphingomonas rubra TaxID=634430 RepID=UPI001FE12B87|nr:hypothetical protein [Sphingomonas rubra]
MNGLLDLLDLVLEVPQPDPVRPIPDAVAVFLDSFERMNMLTLTGPAWSILSEFVDVVRATVPSND